MMQSWESSFLQKFVPETFSQTCGKDEPDAGYVMRGPLQAGILVLEWIGLNIS